MLFVTQSSPITQEVTVRWTSAAPRSAAWLVALGFGLFSGTIFFNWFSAPPELRSDWPLAMSLLFLGVAGIIWFRGRVQKKNFELQSSPRGWILLEEQQRKCEIEEIHLGSLEEDRGRFQAWTTSKQSEPILLFEAQEPAQLWAWAQELQEKTLLTSRPLSLRTAWQSRFQWTLSPLSEDAQAFQFEGLAWQNQKKIRKVLVPLLTAVAVAWIFFLSQSPGPVLLSSVVFAAGSWLALLLVTALSVSDSVRVSWGDSLLLQRSLLGLPVQRKSVPRSEVERLEYVTLPSGRGYLVVTTTQDVFSLPVEPEGGKLMVQRLQATVAP